MERVLGRLLTPRPLPPHPTWSWHGDSRAGERLNRINAWAKPKNGNIVNGYHLNGAEFATHQYPSGVKEVIGAFVGPIALASVKDTQSYQDTMWNKLVSLGQAWKFEHVGGGNYRIVGKQSGLVLEVSGGSGTNGAGIQLWNYLGYNHQKFDLRP